LRRRGRLVKIIVSLLSDDPLGVITGLIDFKVGSSDNQQRNAKLNAIANRVSAIANNQELILQELANMRVLMDEAVRKGFLDNDARDLYAASQQFKHALVDNDQAELLDVKRQTDHLASKISRFGLAGVPAYLSAIALQNSVHFTIKSSPERFISINEEHHQNLYAMLNGDGRSSLSS
jgi:hypothetical protein